MLLDLVSYLWSSLSTNVAGAMDYAYESNYFMGLVSCIMALVFIVHVKSASIILTNLCEPKPRKSLIERQPSPIDIARRGVFRMDHVEALQWYSYDELPPAILLENNGKTVIMRISCGPECTPFISGGTLPGNYYFVEAIFKWGASEHSIDSRSYAMEMQVLHATNMPDAAYEYLTVSYMFALTHQKNQFLDQVVENLWAIRRAGSVIELPPFDLATLMWCFNQDYYTYRGTYANGNVVLPSQWAICPRIFHIGAEQLAQFGALCDEQGCRIAINARKKQPLGDRCVALNC
ncbi:carbonic anhydrase 1 [Drosophila virilis]|uniref:Alpha-carbonic anhydrase domain-containing protein n=1 Tax=Drosophila virilis TaxID=7244 RepID=B4ME69_DROVI|nr:carbonic anhydrase 1 [Drosophila virilis]EDW58834.2 uncharacterized protein Dvir_GJ17403 [Drosophila virilis]